jgi:hypothetical protein
LHHDRHIGKRYRNTLGLLRELVSLAGDQHQIFWQRSSDRELDGERPIRFSYQTNVLSDAGRYRVHDGDWIFMARVVGREHDVIRGAGGRAQQGTLGSIAIAAGAEN